MPYLDSEWGYSTVDVIDAPLVTDSSWGYSTVDVIDAPLVTDSSWGKATITLDNPIDYNNVYIYDGVSIMSGRIQYFDGTNVIDATT